MLPKPTLRSLAARHLAISHIPAPPSTLGVGRSSPRSVYRETSQSLPSSRGNHFALTLSRRAKPHTGRLQGPLCRNSTTSMEQASRKGQISNEGGLSSEWSQDHISWLLARLIFSSSRHKHTHFASAPTFQVLALQFGHQPNFCSLHQPSS